MTASAAESVAGRDQWLALTEEELLRQCRCETCRGSGPGGQKRNKTESAVRVIHLPSGIAAEGDVSRSQHLNRLHALRKLRLEIALRVRRPAPAAPAGPAPGVQADAFVRWVAAAFDALADSGFRLSEAADRMGVSTSRLSKDLAKHSAVWQVVNRERERLGLSRLRQ